MRRLTEWSILSQILSHLAASSLSFVQSGMGALIDSSSSEDESRLLILFKGGGGQVASSSNATELSTPSGGSGTSGAGRCGSGGRGAVSCAVDITSTQPHVVVISKHLGKRRKRKRRRKRGRKRAFLGGPPTESCFVFLASLNSLLFCAYTASLSFPLPALCSGTP